MTEPVRIASLEIENIKRVTALTLTPAATGLTIIGGDNRQGKTSVIDAIAFALGGEAFTPTAPIHDGAVKGKATVTLSNGITATRSVTSNGSYLKVTDPSGKAGGQTLLNQFVHAFALDLSQFMEADDKKKATILLQIIGVDLAPLNERVRTLSEQRLAVGRLRDRQKHHAEAMPYVQDIPLTPISPSEILAKLQTVLEVNARNANLRRDAQKLVDTRELAQRRVAEATAALKRAQDEMKVAETACSCATIEAIKAQTIVANTKDEDTAELSAKLTQIEDLNKKINANLDRTKALDEAEAHAEEYRSLSAQIEAVALQKADLLAAAKMPLDGLTIEEDALCYNGKAWDCMSGAEQLIAATAVCRHLNPQQGFVLIDKAEALDKPTLEQFAKYLADTGLQAITTRVSRGEECTIIIDNGVQAASLVNPKF